MAKPEKIVNRVCGWGGLGLAILPILKLIPIPWLQGLLIAVDPAVAATLGGLGCAVVASTDPLGKSVK